MDGITHDKYLKMWYFKAMAGRLSASQVPAYQKTAFYTDRSFPRSSKKSSEAQSGLKRRKRKEMIIEDAVKTTKRLLTKQRQKERRRGVWRLFRIAMTQTAKKQILNLRLSHQHIERKIVRETAMHVSNQVVESKTYGEKSDNSPIQNDLKVSLKHQNYNQGVKKSRLPSEHLLPWNSYLLERKPEGIIKN